MEVRGLMSSFFVWTSALSCRFDNKKPWRTLRQRAAALIYSIKEPALHSALQSFISTCEDLLSSRDAAVQHQLLRKLKMILALNCGLLQGLVMTVFVFAGSRLSSTSSQRTPCTTRWVIHTLQKTVKVTLFLQSLWAAASVWMPAGQVIQILSTKRDQPTK